MSKTHGAMGGRALFAEVGGGGLNETTAKKSAGLSSSTIPFTENIVAEPCLY